MTQDELQEAIQTVASIMSKIEKVQKKLTLGKSQQTLIEKRLKALKIAQELITREMGISRAKEKDGGHINGI